MTTSLVEPGHKLEALLHDATEAYLSDISDPLKKLLPEYRAIEKKFDAIIREKFGLPEEITSAIQYADKTMLVHEARWLTELQKEDLPDLNLGRVFGELIPLTPQGAYSNFMDTYTQLIGGTDNEIQK